MKDGTSINGDKVELRIEAVKWMSDMENGIHKSKVKLVPTGAATCSLSPTSTISSLILSCSPMLASRDVEELSKQLEIARKRQEVERMA